MKSRFLACVIFIGSLLTPLSLEARSDGITGRTSAAGNGGCGTAQCHGGTANSNTTVSFVGLVDSVIVTPGSTTNISILVAHANAPAAGINIALKTTSTGGQNPSSGGLLVVSGGNLQLLGAELTHTGRIPMVDGHALFQFELVAPTQPGEYFLRAAANAVNNANGSAGDEWNFAPVIRVRVSIADGVESEGSAIRAALGISPVPAHDVMTLTTSATPGSMYAVNVLDLTGSMIFEDHVTSTEDVLRYVWNGTTSAGIQAQPGSYVVAISGNGSVKRGRAVIVR